MRETRIYCRLAGLHVRGVYRRNGFSQMWRKMTTTFTVHLSPFSKLELRQRSRDEARAMSQSLRRKRTGRTKRYCSLQLLERGSKSPRKGLINTVSTPPQIPWKWTTNPPAPLHKGKKRKCTRNSSRSSADPTPSPKSAVKTTSSTTTTPPPRTPRTPPKSPKKRSPAPLPRSSAAAKQL